MFQDKEPDKIDKYLKKLNTPKKKDNSKSKKVSRTPLLNTCTRFYNLRRVLIQAQMTVLVLGSSLTRPWRRARQPRKPPPLLNNKGKQSIQLLENLQPHLLTHRRHQQPHPEARRLSQFRPSSHVAPVVQKPQVGGDTGQAQELLWKSGMLLTFIQRYPYFYSSRKFQKSTHLLIPKLPFSRVIREICTKVIPPRPFLSFWSILLLFVLRSALEI